MRRVGVHGDCYTADFYAFIGNLKVQDCIVYVI